MLILHNSLYEIIDKTHCYEKICRQDPVKDIHYRKIYTGKNLIYSYRYCVNGLVPDQGDPKTFKSNLSMHEGGSTHNVRIRDLHHFSDWFNCPSPAGKNLFQKLKIPL